jgi:dihydroxy-acid dehydratase
MNSWTDVNQGHLPLKYLSERVKERIWAAGDSPPEFNVPGLCDAIAQATGIHFVLFQRSPIAGNIEAIPETCSFQGVAMFASCDKIIPGMIMAAIRCNFPTMFLTAGPMTPYSMRNRMVVTSYLKEAIGKIMFRRDRPCDFSGLTRTVPSLSRNLFVHEDCEHCGLFP